MKRKLFLSASLMIMALPFMISLGPENEEVSTSLCSLGKTTAPDEFSSYFDGKSKDCYISNPSITNHYTLGFLPNTNVVYPGSCSIDGYTYTFQEYIKVTDSHIYDNSSYAYLLRYENYTDKYISARISTTRSGQALGIEETHTETTAKSSSAAIEAVLSASADFAKAEVSSGFESSEETSASASDSFTISITNESNVSSKTLMMDYYFKQTIYLYVFYSSYQWEKDYLYCRDIVSINCYLK